MMNISKKIIAFIFLGLFSCIQLLDLHVLEHDMDATDCDICHIISQDISDDNAVIHSFEFIEHTIPIDVRITNHYTTSELVNAHFFGFFNKPPPTTFIS